MYALPGMQPLGATGVALLYNASLPYNSGQLAEHLGAAFLTGVGRSKVRASFPEVSEGVRNEHSTTE